jgi:hypothetical protein
MPSSFHFDILSFYAIPSYLVFDLLSIYVILSSKMLILTLGFLFLLFWF